LTQVIQRGRHRAAGRPQTALDDLASSLTSSIPTGLGRGAAAVVASSGLVLAGAAAAHAAPGGDSIGTPSLKATQLDAEGIARAGTQSRITADAEASLALTAATVTAEAPPPPPPVVRTVTSRTRTAATAVATGGGSEGATEESYAPAPVIDGDLAAAIVAEAYKYIGTPYVSGGASPGGFDCSGFTQYVYGQFGISLPRTSGAQRNAGYVVSASEARAGDLIWAPGHVGIYLGDGQHIAARNPSTPLAAGPVYMSNPVFIRVL